MSITTNEAKNGGIYCTPPELAKLVVDLAIHDSNSKILDPCFGHGALLFSAYQRLLVLDSNDTRKQLFGCDILRPPDNVMNSLDTILDRENLIEDDFFNLTVSNFDSKFDAIIMNPPFVRHHLIPDTEMERLNKKIIDTIHLPKTSDLWAYFIIWSLNYLKPKGSLAAILPWSFLHSDYSRVIRKHLIDIFGDIRIIMIGEQLFNNAQERIVILLAEKYGESLSDIKTAYSYNIPSKPIEWSPISLSSVNNTLDYDFTAVHEYEYLEELQKRIDFKPLGNVADIKIGTVTGANNFFVIDNKDISDLGIPEGWAVPIIAKAEDITKFTCIFRKDSKHRLLMIPVNRILPDALRAYITEGEKKGLQNGHHNSNRSVWYSLTPKNPPDAFFPYMIKELPIIVLNPEKLLSTNNIHGLYVNENCTADTINWIQFSILSSVSQLSIEINSRTYGSGVLKIEPSAAKKTLVFTGNGYRFPIEIEAQIKELIESGLRSLANELVDKWFIQNKLISVEDNELAKRYYLQLKEIRLRKT